MEESIKEYNIGILKQVQAIFGHLAYSKLQYYIPRGLWKHFKLVERLFLLLDDQLFFIILQLFIRVYNITPLCADNHAFI